MTGCLCPTSPDNLTILTGIQPAELCRNGATPWRASIGSHQVQCNIPIFAALLRKKKYLFLERCSKPNNVWLHALMQTNCLYLFLFFEHYNRILLVTECLDIAVFVRLSLSWHAAFILYLASTSLAINILLCNSVVLSFTGVLFFIYLILI